MSEQGVAQAAVRVEWEAAVAGAVAGVIGLIAGIIAFWGGAAPLWVRGWSIGALAAIVAGALGLVAAFIAYWRSRYQPGQEWRLDIPSWKFILDAIAVAFVHAAIAAIGSVGVFAVLQGSFRGLDLDMGMASVLVGVVSGIAAYWIWISCGTITTRRMSSLLVIYMTISVFAAMLTTSDPLWWEYHFSQLGSLGDGAASLFNITLVAAGALVVVFAVYLGRDLRTLLAQGKLVRASTPRTVEVLFVVMGVMLAGVGLVSVPVSEPLHIAFASGMFAVFIGMLIAAPWLFQGMPRTLVVVTWVFLAGIVLTVVLFFPIGYFNLTGLELIAFALIFGWIAVFIRFEAATIVTPTADPTGVRAGAGA